MKSIILQGMALLGCLLGVCFAQSRPEGQPAFDMDERTLAERYHIASTTQGLMSALDHSDATVRKYAAMRLAATGAKEAIPAILSALVREDFAGVQIGLASAALKLGAPEGLRQLTAMCHNPNWSPMLWMSSASAMLDNGREDCFEDVMAVLRSRQDVQATAYALDQIIRFKQLSATQVGAAQAVLAECIASQTPLIRQVTASNLSRMGGVWATETVRRALAKEQDEGVKAIMSRSLASMEKKK
jgi:HEAT repeat protein